MTQQIDWQAMTENERDALIAEKVFGWQWVLVEQCKDIKQQDDLIPFIASKNTSWLLPDDGLKDKNYLGASWQYINNKQVMPRNWIPHYSISMGAAWLIVERMKEPDSPADFHDLVDELADNTYVFDFLWHLTPERICLAALIAFGCDVEMKHRGD